MASNPDWLYFEKRAARHDETLFSAVAQEAVAEGDDKVIVTSIEDCKRLCVLEDTFDC